ncbi:MAG: hypothetical protein PHN42_01150 [Bacilli bacterium]|nr:hypothetical protein [Bacilli bacterium]
MLYDLKMNKSNIILNDDFIIYYTQPLKTFAEMSFKNLNMNKKIILNFFKLNEFRKVMVILFDDITQFRNYVLSLRDTSNKLPEYATSVFDRGVIISYIDLEKIKESENFINKVKTNLHEFIHIVNKEQIYEKRILWLDEGLAVNLDGTREYLEYGENFKEFLNTRILNIKNLPNMNDLNHGNNFINNDYNGYDLSYLCVKYLIDLDNIDEFQRILRDYN